VTKWSGKGSKKISFIISTQPFLIVASSVLMSNLAYPDGTRIRNIIFEKEISCKTFNFSLSIVLILDIYQTIHIILVYTL
jgi:hypothetical protein